MAPNKGHKSQSISNPNTERRPSKKAKSLKQKIRDVRRLLRQTDIPGAVRVAQERMLDLLHQTVKEKTKEERERKLTKKYKMVQFFEKRKVMRKFKACQNELKTCADSEKSKLESQLQTLKYHWNYVTYFPSDTKYISLYPPVPYQNAAVVENQEKILTMIKEKIEMKTIPDASESISTSPVNKAKVSPCGKRGLICLDKKAMQDAKAAEELPQQGGDVFFIDTSGEASPELSPDKGSHKAAKDEKTTFSVQGSSHKLKRLKNSRKESPFPRKSATSKGRKNGRENKEDKDIKKKDCAISIEL